MCKIAVQVIVNSICGEMWKAEICNKYMYNLIDVALPVLSSHDNV